MGTSVPTRVNNTSEEEDYDEGLPEEEEGITCYIRYCPKDNGYLQGTDCNRQGYLAHDTRHLEMDECQESTLSSKENRAAPRLSAQLSCVISTPQRNKKDRVYQNQVDRPSSAETRPGSRLPALWCVFSTPQWNKKGLSLQEPRTLGCTLRSSWISPAPDHHGQRNWFTLPGAPGDSSVDRPSSAETRPAARLPALRLVCVLSTPQCNKKGPSLQEPSI
ncbi:hypothetical protein AB1E18_015581 [Capra hircus]